MADNQRKRIPCSILRGGTSKGVYLLENHLPRDGKERDEMLLKLMGSPDIKQINGLGGAASVTSKVAIISVSKRPDADVDYTFAQVGVDKPVVSYKGNCGNISSGVGPFAIEQGLVKVTEPVTPVRIYNTNTDKVIVAEVEIRDNKVRYDGDFAIAGVKGTGSPIKLKFLDPAGSISGKLLPTGNAVDVLQVPGVGDVSVSIVDAANPLVFARASDLGLTGRELPSALDMDAGLLGRLEAVRGMAAVKMGLIKDYRNSAWEMPGVPKMTFVAEPADYTTSMGETARAGEVDLLGRMMSMQKAHPTYAMTGAMCTAAAAVIPGTIVNQVMQNGAGNLAGAPEAEAGTVNRPPQEETNTRLIRIGHAGGILEAGVDYRMGGADVTIRDTFGFRTANLIMEGAAYLI